MRPVMLRSGLALAAMFMLIPSSRCLAEAPEAVEEERTKATLPSGAAFDQPAEPSAPNTSIDLDEVNLNIIDQKLALSLAVDTWGQIAANERALVSAQSELLRQLIAQRLETQRTFAGTLNTLTDGRTNEAIDDARREIAADANTTTAKVVRFRPLSLHKNATAMMVRIRLEILQEYLAGVEAGLESQSSTEFDRHFLRGDILHQMQLLAMLEVFQRQASADFAGVIAHEVNTAKDHLAKSRQTLLELEAAPLAGATAIVPLDAH